MGEAETSNCSEGLSQQEYEVLEQPLGTPRHIRIITIGAGASGLNMVRTLRKHLKNFEHVVYDKNPDIGGTWYENRYPRCKCDIPSHNYQFSWRPNPEWPAFYSSHDEIHGYLKRLCDEEHLWDSIRLSHRVTRAEWNEDEGKWHLHIKDVTTDAVINDHCDFLLDASGILKWVHAQSICEV
jgi:cation diffusion facilitator CzcD-associated flavoprotein CzcO